RASDGSNISLFGEDGDDSYTLDATRATPLHFLVVALEEIQTIGPEIPLIDKQTTGVDTIEFAGLFGVTFDLRLSTQTVGGDVSVTLRGTFENVLGTPGPDKLTGNGADNYLYGGAGDDTLIAGSGNATLEGGAGNDSLIAGTGDTTYRFAGSN